MQTPLLTLTAITVALTACGAKKSHHDDRSATAAPSNGQIVDDAAADRAAADKAVEAKAAADDASALRLSKGTNYLQCRLSSSGRSYVGCVLNSAEIAPVQAVDSTFTITYDFYCAPGNSTWLLIGIQEAHTPGQQLFNFGQAGTLTATGKGPVKLVDLTPHKTAAVNFNKGCSLIINSVQIARLETPAA